jgi:hypothetical protein
MALKSSISLTSRAAALYERSKVEERRQLIALVCSNLRLEGKKLEFSLRSPFELRSTGERLFKWLWN